MTEEITKDIYRIGVSLPGNPLKELNSYFIRGKDRSLLIDTGFRRPECRKDLQKGLQELCADFDHLDVFATHLHADHSGMVRDFASEDGTIFMSDSDLKRLHIFLDEWSERKYLSRHLREGFPEDKLSYVADNNPAFQMTLEKIDDRFWAVEDGTEIPVGDYRLQVLSVPGHTPGNTMLWLKEQGIMFTSDHILFDITPNITAWTGVEDSLGDYLNSLEKVKDYPVKLSLPGHRKPGDYHERIRQLQRHHERRLAEVTEAVKKRPGMTAYEIAGYMKWKISAGSWDEFPPIQQWFAVGECMAHIDYLLKRGVIRREEGAAGGRPVYK